MKPDHIDILVIGAGLSGIGAACHLRKSCPGREFAILEARDCIGGTWDLFRYPGRALGFRHVHARLPVPAVDRAPSPSPMARPSWITSARPRASTASIARSASTTASGARRGRRRRRDGRSRSSAGPDNEPARFTCNFLLMCSGYYSYAEGYTPAFPGIARFKGRVVHPQSWTEDVDYANKRVVVIGSGATAVTLVPELANRRRHVTMLQRSPTYVVAWPDEDRIANALRRWLPARSGLQHRALEECAAGMYFYRHVQERSRAGQGHDPGRLRAELGPDYDIATHFTPRYDPWDQRLCLAPNGDLFKSIKQGTTTIVTDEIETFTKTGHQAAIGPRAGGRPRRDRHRAQPAGHGRRRDRSRRRARDPADHAQLQRRDVQRRPQPCGGVRLHQRLVDPESRSHQRLRLPPAELYASTRPRQCTPRNRDPGPSSGCRPSISPRAISSGRWTSCRGRDRASRGASTRTMSGPYAVRFAPLNDGVLEFAARPISRDTQGGAGAARSTQNATTS